MRLTIHASVTAHERTAVASWIESHFSDDVDLVVVEEAAIAVFGPLDGPNPGAIGVAVRNGRRLTDELHEALADLRGKVPAHRPALTTSKNHYPDRLPVAGRSIRTQMRGSPR